ncbi:hypothetical protein A1O1_01127 [Capronia coronata CBS 617.96]|uniref:Uncharacterized protein n=1 Tax=Capronia coronata CBS 617.96 TaxID=1182541 RepID=W9Z344_9EURO|nr:uncharacterized protein A1O1_01127 [Capronia coronata CBS 617.96]EXJ96001.1 hypothetical protein A1O1_01127 [Capronia coronata CBS 617.96]
MIEGQMTPPSSPAPLIRNDGPRLHFSKLLRNSRSRSIRLKHLIDGGFREKSCKCDDVTTAPADVRVATTQLKPGFQFPLLLPDSPPVTENRETEAEGEENSSVSSTCSYSRTLLRRTSASHHDLRALAQAQRYDTSSSPGTPLLPSPIPKENEPLDYGLQQQLRSFKAHELVLGNDASQLSSLNQRTPIPWTRERMSSLTDEECESISSVQILAYYCNDPDVSSSGEEELEDQESLVTDHARNTKRDTTQCSYSQVRQRTFNKDDISGYDSSSDQEEEHPPEAEYIYYEEETDGRSISSSTVSESPMPVTPTESEHDHYSRNRDTATLSSSDESGWLANTTSHAERRRRFKARFYQVVQHPWTDSFAYSNHAGGEDEDEDQVSSSESDPASQDLFRFNDHLLQPQASPDSPFQQDPSPAWEFLWQVKFSNINNHATYRLYWQPQRVYLFRSRDNQKPLLKTPVLQLQSKHRYKHNRNHFSKYLLSVLMILLAPVMLIQPQSCYLFDADADAGTDTDTDIEDEPERGCTKVDVSARNPLRSSSVFYSSGLLPPPLYLPSRTRSSISDHGVLSSTTGGASCKGEADGRIATLHHQQQLQNLDDPFVVTSSPRKSKSERNLRRLGAANWAIRDDRTKWPRVPDILDTDETTRWMSPGLKIGYDDGTKRTRVVGDSYTYTNWTTFRDHSESDVGADKDIPTRQSSRTRNISPVSPTIRVAASSRIRRLERILKAVTQSIETFPDGMLRLDSPAISEMRRHCSISSVRSTAYSSLKSMHSHNINSADFDDQNQNDICIDAFQKIFPNAPTLLTSALAAWIMVDLYLSRLLSEEDPQSQEPRQQPHRSESVFLDCCHRGRKTHYHHDGSECRLFGFQDVLKEESFGRDDTIPSSAQQEEQQQEEEEGGGGGGEEVETHEYQHRRDSPWEQHWSHAQPDMNALTNTNTTAASIHKEGRRDYYIPAKARRTLGIISPRIQFHHHDQISTTANPSPTLPTQHQQGLRSSRIGTGTGTGIDHTVSTNSHGRAYAELDLDLELELELKERVEAIYAHVPIVARKLVEALRGSWDEDVWRSLRVLVEIIEGFGRGNTSL